MNSHVRIEDIHVHTPLHDAANIKRALPNWFAAAMLLVAGVLTLAWATFLFWLPGYLAGVW